MRALATASMLLALIAVGCSEEKPRVGGFCNDGSECPAGQACLDGQCVFSCALDSDCADGFVCEETFCVPACENDGECDPNLLGQQRSCQAGRCTDVDAPGFLTIESVVEVDEASTFQYEAEDVFFTSAQGTVIEWVQTGSLPEGIEVDLEGLEYKVDSVEGGGIRFEVPTVLQDTQLFFDVIMRDPDGVTLTQSFEVVIRNTINEPPEIGFKDETLIVEEGDSVVLDATSAFDPNSDALTFEWSYTGWAGDLDITDAAEPGEPAFSRVSIVAPNVSEDTAIVLTVVVNDGEDSAQASQTLFVEAKECDPGDDAICDDANPCTETFCEDDGTCGSTNLDIACDDDDPCTEDDACVEGACTPGAPVDCDDGNPCTTDSCGAGGCESVNFEAPCDDGDACTVGDQCLGGACVPGNPADCDDGNLCTTDSCDSQLGCESINDDGAPCDDGNSCTSSDFCAAGSCSGGPSVDCNDGNPCTDDGCDPASGCTVALNAEPCDDGDACTTGDTCSGGACATFAPVVCDDGNPCTADGCDSATGCTTTNLTVGCDDGDACTTADTCSDGACVGGAAPNCDDGEFCTDDSCDPASGCLNVPGPVVACDDGDPCTSDGVCAGGSCTPGEIINCNDGNPCTDDSCGPSGCVSTPNTAPCDDGDACTPVDTCSGGACVGAGVVDCDDDNVCTIDVCDSGVGCEYSNSGAFCDDGSACTTGDFCNGFTCVGDLAVVCDDGNPCTVDSCDPAVGCVAVSDDGASCDDGSACTVGDSCLDSACQPGPENPACECEADAECAEFDDGNPCTGTLICVDFACVVDDETVVTCSASDDPCLANTCNTESGACELVPANNGGICDDGDACTVSEACSLGSCTGGLPVNCDDGNVCTSDSCSPSSGCNSSPQDGVCDDDSNACTVNGACVDGTCELQALECDDDNICTADACSPALGCVFTGVAGACDDGNACTVDDSCSTGLCQPGAPIVCSDGNLCTNDVCNVVTGCNNPSNTNPCDDGEICTTGDTCSGGSCVGTPAVCDDGNPCTVDACVLGTGCEFTPSSGAVCDDDDVCSTASVCSAGECTGTEFIVCDDDNPCTLDACNQTVGCTTNPIGGECDDGNACTNNDLCVEGGCVGGAAPVCDDGDVCTDDSCDDAVGCVFSLNVADCDDGNACTVGDTCNQGLCFGAPIDCDDENECTADGCNVESGCTNFPSEGECDDGNDCTLGDFCSGGECVGGEACECLTDEDCEDDGDLCNGVPKCNIESLSCELDPSTIVVCEDASSTDCIETTCDPELGACTDTNVASATSCNDGSACTVADNCDGFGNCLGLTLSCNDENDCTSDSCNPATGCVFSPFDNECDDGDPCTQFDFCEGGECVGSEPCECLVDEDCVDDKPGDCTDLVCDVESLSCQTVPASSATPCDDGNSCTTSDACDGGGSCVGVGGDCDDGNVCTIGECDPAEGCIFSTITDVLCEDGNLCTINESCIEGECVAPVFSPGCFESDSPGCNGCDCEEAVCAVDSFCCATAWDNICAGECADPAIGGGLCPPGLGNGGGEGGPGLDPADFIVICDDGDQCTDDSCDPDLGCVFSPKEPGSPCNDGDFCSSDDVCDEAGNCAGFTECDDGNPCTEDSCGEGCINTDLEVGTPCGGQGEFCDGTGTCIQLISNQFKPPVIAASDTAELTSIHESEFGQLEAAGAGAVGTEGEVGFVFRIEGDASVSSLQVRNKGLRAIYGGAAVGYGGAISIRAPADGTYNVADELESAADGSFVNPDYNDVFVRKDEFGLPVIHIAGDGLFSGIPTLQCSQVDGVFCFSGGPDDGDFSMLRLKGAAPSDFSFRLFGLSERPDLGSGPITQLWSGSNVEGFTDWTASPPAGCTVGEGGVCDPVGDWADLVAPSLDEAYALAANHVVLAYDGKTWQPLDVKAGLPSFVDPDTAESRTLAVRSEHLFVAVESVGCPKDECASDPTFQSAYLAHFNLISGEWQDPIVIGSIECPAAFAPKTCENYRESFRVNDMWWSDSGQFGIVGSSPVPLGESFSVQLQAFVGKLTP